MSATVTDLAARALRRIGVAVVSAANRPTDGDISSALSIVYQALRDLGINPVSVPSSDPSASVVSVTSLAAQALRAVGINPVAQADASAPTGTITVTEIAARALRGVGINLVAQSLVGSTGSGPRTPEYIAQRALQRLGVNLVDEPSAPAVDGAIMTQAAIATLALQHLGVIDSDETPLAADLTVAETELLAFHNYCASQNIVHWLETAIPQQVGVLYAIGVAATLAPVFGKSADPQGYSGAMAAIKAIALSGTYAQAFAADHFTMVHDDLVGRNLVSWAPTAVPDAASEWYSLLIAQQMATAFGQAFDPGAYNGAKSALKRLALSGAAGQTLAEARVTSIHMALAAQNVVSWAVGAIPAQAGEAYVAITMAALGGSGGDDDFVIPSPLPQAPVGHPDPTGALNGAAGAAVAQLRVMALSGSYGQTLAEGKINDVHAALNGRNLVSWLVTAIPTSVAEAYISMAAVLLAPSVGRPADMNVYEAGFGAVRQAVLSGAYAVAFGQAAIVNVHDSLADSALVTWTKDTIPASVGDAYSTLVEAQLAPTFGKQANPQESQAARDMIARVSMIMGSQSLAEQTLREWHSEWRARGMTRWEVLDIPREAEESYIAATGYRLAPQFPGAHSPQDAVQRAEDALYRITAIGSTGVPVTSDWF